MELDLNEIKNVLRIRRYNATIHQINSLTIFFRLQNT